MTQCNFTSDVADNLNGDIAIIYSDLINDSAESNGTLNAETIQVYNKRLIDLIGLYKEYFPLDTVATTFIDLCNSYGINDFCTNHEIMPWTSSAQIISIMNGQEVPAPTRTNDADAKRLELVSPGLQRTVDSKNFLLAGFGGAAEQRNRCLKNVSVRLSNACIINRDPRMSHSPIPLDALMLTNNIHQMQQSLYDDVLDFFKSDVVTDNKLIEENSIMYNPKTGEYTNAVHNLQHMIQQVLNPENFSTHTILELDAPNASEYAKKKLKAYGSWLCLTHFDSLLESRYGNSIYVTKGRYGDMIFEGKEYSFSEKGSEYQDVWNNEEIDLTKAVNKIVQEIINTTPRYNRGSAEPIEDAYLEFQETVAAVIKIKMLMYAKDIIFNDSIINQFKDKNRKNGLSEETVNLIRDKSLHTLISNLRLDGQTYFPPIIEILSHLNVKTVLSDQIQIRGNEIFSTRDLNTIYSLHKGVFSDELKSLRGVNKMNLIGKYTHADKNNVYSYVTQAFDTISGIMFLQYWMDENGAMHTRSMQEGALRNAAYQAKLTINGQLSRRRGMYQRTKDTYLVNKDAIVQNYYLTRPPIFRLGTLKNGNELRCEVGVGNATRWMSYNPETKQSQDLTTIEMPTNFVEVVRDITGLQVPENFNTDEIGYMQGVGQVMNMLAHILKNTVISNELLTPDAAASDGRMFTKTWLDERLRKTDISALNLKVLLSGELDLVSKEDINILNKLVTYIGRVRGTLDTTQVKNNEGNTQSTAATSRLNGNVKQQIVIKHTPTYSAACSFSFVTNPNIFAGLYTAKEIALKDGQTVDHSSFTVAEFATSGLFYQYLNGLISEDANDIISSNYIGFYPSVNSDKNTFNTLLIDANQKVEVSNGIVSLDEISDGTYLVTEELRDNLRNSRKAFINFLKRENIFFDNFLYLKGKSSANLNKSDIDYIINHSDIFNAITNTSKYKNHYIYENVAIKDLKLELIKSLQNEELGRYYRNVESEINKDFARLIDYIASKDESVKASLSIANTALSGINTNNFVLSNFKLLNYIWGNQAVVNVRKWCSLYNQENPNNPIRLIDQTHFIDIAGTLQSNPTLRSILGRTYLEGEADIERKQAKSRAFDLRKNAEILGALANSKFQFRLDPLLKSSDSEENTQSVQTQLEAIYKQFSGLEKFKTGNSTTDTEALFALAKWIPANGLPIYIKNETDLRALQKQIAPNGVDGTYHEFAVAQETGLGRLELNPVIERYNALHTLFTQEYMITTVGSHINHPSKVYDKKISKYIKGAKIGQGLNMAWANIGDSFWRQGLYDPMKDEAARFNAQHKRNVSNTATMNEFHLGLVDGITHKYKVAVVKDVFATQYNINGDIEDGIKPYDGASFAEPTTVYEENISLRGAKVGLSKKGFVHAVDSKTGTAKIIKTCVFAITNNSMRNQVQMRKMAEKMMNLEWRDESGTKLTDLNITLDYYGNSFFQRDSQPKSIWGLKPIIFKARNGEYVEVTDIQYIGNNQYNIIGDILNVQKNKNQLGGQKLGTKASGLILNALIQDTQDAITINNNWTLFQCLGGWNSLTQRGNTLVPSETSILNLATLNSRVGIIKTDKNGNPLNQVLKQDDVYQPLKQSKINYIVTEGAIKQGACNINYNNTYADDTPFDWFTIDMEQAGVLLDKEHHGEDTELALMTLVISACAHRGYSLKQTIAMYKALANLANMECSDILDPFEKYQLNPALRDQMIASVVKTVYEGVAKSDVEETSLLSKISSDIIKKIKSGKALSTSALLQHAAVDDPAIFPQFIQEVMIYLTKGIRLRIPGQLAVLNPSHGLFKLYAGRTYSEIENNDLGLSAEEYLNTLQAELEVITDPANINIGRTYNLIRTDGLSESVTINHPTDYYALKQRFATGEVTGVVENIIVGRELGSYNVRGKGIISGGKEISFQLYDLDSTKALFDLQFEDSLINWYVNNKSIFLNEDQEAAQKVYTWLAAHTGENIDPKLLTRAKNKFADLCRKRQHVELQAMSPESSNSEIPIRINGLDVLIDPKSILIIPYELITSKHSKRQMGLSDEDNVWTIKNTPNFFLDKVLSKLNTPPTLSNKHYDIELKRLNGEHVHIMIERNFATNGGGLKSMNYQSDYIHGKLYKINANTGKPEMKINPEDRFYLDENGNEIIVTQHPEHYIRQIKHMDIQLSDRLQEKEVVHILENIKKNLKSTQEGRTRKSDLYLKKWINWAIKNPKEFLELNAAKVNISDLAAGASNKKILKLIHYSNQLGNSFNVLLKVIASRTPSQSMQSVMSMQIAAFETVDLNNAYVSSAQIWLQGSDYDVDAVSLAQYEVDQSGLLATWSPFADLNTEEFTKVSLNIPFPTFVEKPIEEVTTETFDLAIPLLDDIVKTSKEIGFSSNLLNEEDSESKVTPIMAKILLDKYGEVPFYDPESTVFLDRYNDEDAELINSVYSLINTHNTYLLNLDINAQESAAKNFVQHMLYTIMSSPKNLPQAMQSVDAVTGPAKNLASKSSKGGPITVATPGAFTNMAEAAISFMAGREAIGICAVGLKSFFALSAYYDSMLASGDMKAIERLFLKHNDIGDFHFPKLIANVICDPQIANKNELLAAALAMLNSEDAALQLSAFLSLATDNAKDPVLDKLNANPAMISLYLYAITIGIPINKVGDLLVSPLGDLCSQILKGNVFAGTDAPKDMAGVIKYLTEFPYTLLGEARFKAVPTGCSGLAEIKSYLEKLRIIEKLKEGNPNFDKLTEDQLNQAIAEAQKAAALAKQRSMAQAEESGGSVRVRRVTYGDIVNLLKEMYANPADATKAKLYKSLQSFMLDASKRADKNMQNLALYNTQLSILHDSGNYPKFLVITELHRGAVALKALGRMLSLNQGIKPKLSDVLYKILGIEEDYNIDLVRFCTDAEYQEKAITSYGAQYPINGLDCIVHVPHAFEYLKLLAAGHNSMETVSPLYKFVYEKSTQYRDLYSLKTFKDSLRLTNGLRQFYIDHVRDRFLSQYKFTNVPDLDYFIDGKHFKLSKGSINLGTADGNAAFKMWFETQLIPKLKKSSSFSRNRFISDLLVFTSDKNSAMNTIINYSLPINMLPRTELEKATFQLYKTDFNSLSGVSEMVGEQQMNLADLFYIYSLIAHKGSRGPNSLMSIFEDFLTLESGIASKYLSFEADFAKQGHFEEGIDFSIEQVEPYILPRVMNEKGKYYPKMYVYSPEQFNYTLIAKSDGLTQYISQSRPDQQYEAFYVNKISADNLRLLEAIPLAENGKTGNLLVIIKESTKQIDNIIITVGEDTFSVTQKDFDELKYINVYWEDGLLTGNLAFLRYLIYAKYFC